MSRLAPGRLQYGYNDKQVTKNTRIMVDSWWRDLINRYGVMVNYYPIDINTDGRHPIYEEVFEFKPPTPIRAAVELSNEAWMFSKFGLTTDSDFVAVVHVGTWMNTFGGEIENEPKVGDVISVTNLGWEEDEVSHLTNTGYASGDGVCDLLNKNIRTTCQLATSAHELALKLTDGEESNGETYLKNLTLTMAVSDGDWRRWPQLYQITEKRYNDPEFETNFLNGHYVWVLKAKRFEYSYEEGAPQENPDAGDNTPGGIVNDDPIIDDISDDIFDYDENEGSNDSVYGNY